jgi:signal transduction histidine kinase
MVSVRFSVGRWIRAQDLVWLLLFSALALVSSRPSPQEIAVLLCLGLFQTFERRISFFSSQRGMALSALAKLALCYLLLGWTGGISSTYYVILLLPVVSAATTLSFPGALATTVLACFTYLSFLLYVDWTHYELTPEAVGELSLRVIFLPVVGFLTYQLARENRAEARRYQTAAAQLEDAKQSLQVAEAAVRRSERLAALGQLTAGLAHELRNPLGTMRASAEMLSRSVPAENEIAREMTGFIAAEVDRANSLITRFLDFARPVHLHLRSTDLTQIVDEAISELQRHNPPLNVSVHRNYSPDIPRLMADSELMQRVFYNLLLNAAQATPAGGTVTVRTRRTADYAEVSVIDRGRGIERDNLEQIFNPFFTTRSDGVGLGLAIVSRIVDEHKGRITAESDAGAGSVFRVFLPAP